MGKKRKQHMDKRMEYLRQKRIKSFKRMAFIFTELLIIAALSFATYGMFKYSKFQVNVIDKNQIIINEGGEKEGYSTIALFGGDSRDGGLGEGNHADTIMLVSIDNSSKDVNIVSVYRDTVSLQENGSYTKINNAYYVGGPVGAINVLNMNYDLDIMHYATVDFSVLTKVIDLLGGVELDISEAEMNAINIYLDETASVSGVVSTYLTDSGVQLVDGAQAVTYARIRKNVGDDYARTERQRELLQVLFEKVNIFDLKAINELIDTIFSQVSTNFTVYEILEMATAINKYNIKETMGYPVYFDEPILSKVGSCIVPNTHLKNVELLHQVLYPNIEYEASNKVLDINQGLEEISTTYEQ